MKWCIQNFNPLITTIGLIFDLIGAWLVAWEIVQQYKGEKFATVDIANLNSDSTAEDIVKEHPRYKLFEASKYRKMKWGIAFLTLGFILQIIPNLCKLFCIDFANCSI